MKFISFICLIAAGLILNGCRGQEQPSIPAQQKLDLANTFYNNQLFEAAVKEYREYLDNYTVDNNQRANINYTIANIYFDRLRDYNRALEYYLRVKYLYPESNLQSDVGKQIVSCLERLERSQDARRVLEQETALKPEEVPEHRPGAVIARIGDGKITQGDLDYELGQLPPYMRTQVESREQKLQFLKQYIAEELLYESAKRQGLDREKDVIDATFRAKKGIMAQKVLEEELEKQVGTIDQQDVELYYQANKDRYAEKNDQGEILRYTPLQECAQQVARDLMLERQAKAYQELIDRLLKTRDVTIYDKRIE